MFKPNLIPNSKVSNPIDIPAILGKLGRVVGDYIISKKKDGCRVEVDGYPLKSREMKVIKSEWIQKRYKKFAEVCKANGVIVEGEFYAHGMSFREICRFFKTANVTDPKHRKKLEADTFKFNLKGTVDKPIWEKVTDYQALINIHEDGHIPKFEQDWPGRSSGWMSTYHEDLKIWPFDVYFINYPELDYSARLQWLFSHILTESGIFYEFRDILEIGEWYNLPTEWNISAGEITNFETLNEFYDSVLEDGWEGLVLAYSKRTYKFNRSTAAEADLFKMKEDKLQYDGRVLDIIEGTVVRDGIEKKKNALGRSVTSKLAEDREPSGYASGILTEYEGHTHIVSPQGYSHEELKEMLDDKDKYIGRWFHYAGMKPTKNCPRHAHFARNPWRDSK